MIIIDLSKEKNLETALRSYKNKVQKTKQIQNLRERKRRHTSDLRATITRLIEIVPLIKIQELDLKQMPLMTILLEN